MPVLRSNTLAAAGLPPKPSPVPQRKARAGAKPKTETAARPVPAQVIVTQTSPSATITATAQDETSIQQAQPSRASKRKATAAPTGPRPAKRAKVYSPGESRPVCNIGDLDHQYEPDHLNFLCSCPSSYLDFTSDLSDRFAFYEKKRSLAGREIHYQMGRLHDPQERLKTCSGRDELCHEVLNDDWASHPTWASEDSGFIAHRKNVHEEGLHKIEEERHDYDFNIEAIGRTIQLLEPIAQQLRRMPEKDRESLEIPAGLGGQSETIHKRVIMKLYGREKGHQVIDNLHGRPYAVIPVLLNRLKQKQEEWKTAQREWEKIWRDQTQKMFWKSLDHQAVNAKTNDKKQFQTKTLIAEIQTKFEEQKKSRVYGASASVISKPQMSFKFEDIDVIMDASHLVLTYAEAMHSTEFPRLTSFVREFIPLFFGLDVEWYNMQMRNKFGNSPSNETADEPMASTEDALGAKVRKTNGKKDDLRRGVLDRARGRKEDGSNTPASRASTPDNTIHADEEMSDGGIVTPVDDRSETANETWAEYPAGVNNFKGKNVVLDEPYARSLYNLYGNSSIYCFLRMFCFLYERLYNLKQSEPEVHETVSRAMAPKPAIELGIVDKLPADFFGDISLSADYYRQVLGMFEEFIKGDMDMIHIEETLRRYYLQTGWQLYSFDKLLSALVRFAIGIVQSEGKEKSWDILGHFKKDRAKEDTTNLEEMAYRKAIEKLIKDGDMYKIAYVSTHHCHRYDTLLTCLLQDQDLSVMTIKVLKKDEPTFDPTRMILEDAWRVYVADFLSVAPTVGAPIDQVHLSILPRNIRVMSKEMTSTSGTEEEVDAFGRRFDIVKAKEGLDFKVAVEDLGIFFDINKDEYFVQPTTARDGPRTAVEDSESATHHRVDALQDTFVMNNDAMKGLSKDDVEGKNEGFGSLVKGSADDSADSMEL